MIQAQLIMQALTLVKPTVPTNGLPQIANTFTSIWTDEEIDGLKEALKIALKEQQ